MICVHMDRSLKCNAKGEWQVVGIFKLALDPCEKQYYVFLMAIYVYGYILKGY